MIRFDESLPVFAKTIVEALGEKALAAGCVLRSSSGHLSFFHNDRLKEDQKKAIAASLQAIPWTRKDRVLADLNDFGASELLNDTAALTINEGSLRFRLVDRRLIGADWLRHPRGRAAPPPRFVFASLKGGVGRSTALAVAANELSSRGLRVLAVDLDLEAPGLGPMLLSSENLPKYGSLDALVEDSVTGLDASFVADLIGSSGIAASRGRVDVVPAFGRSSLSHPRNVLAKIARAYVEDVSSGKTLTLLDRVSRLIGFLETKTRYDAILIDTRAGLHESTAASILGLGGDVLLFGLDEAQTFEGYLALLSHLAQFWPEASSPPEWLDRLTMVHGKAPADPNQRQAFVEKTHQLFVDAGLNRRGNKQEVSFPAAPFNDVPWDDTEGTSIELDDPPVPIPILDDSRFRHFAPLINRDTLLENVYRASYGALLDFIDDVMSVSAQEPNRDER